MTREDLLKGNAEIAAQFGKDVRQYCPNVKHIVVIFNPADITGLITLLYSGLKPSQVLHWQHWTAPVYRMNW